MKRDNPSRRHYFITHKLEAGIVLSGQEVKAVKTRGIQLKDAFVQIKEGEAFLVNANIAPYRFASSKDYSPLRSRKLLLKKKEIAWLLAKRKEKLTIIPLSCYTKHGWIKVLLGIGRKKKKKEKKEEAIRKETARQRRRKRFI